MVRKSPKNLIVRVALQQTVDLAAAAAQTQGALIRDCVWARLDTSIEEVVPIRHGLHQIVLLIVTPVSKLTSPPLAMIPILSSQPKHPLRPYQLSIFERRDKYNLLLHQLWLPPGLRWRLLQALLWSNHACCTSQCDLRGGFSAFVNHIYGHTFDSISFSGNFRASYNTDK